MTTELDKRFELLLDIEKFEVAHNTTLRDFRKENKFPIPRGRQHVGLLDRIFRRKNTNFYTVAFGGNISDVGKGS